VKKALILFFLFLLVIPLSLAYTRSDDFKYQYPLYDSAGTAFVATKSATINSSADIALECSISSKTITGTPYIIQDGILIYGTNFVEFYNSGCEKIADISLGTDLYSPASYYNDSTTQWVFVPLDNNTLEVYTFNSTHFTINSTHDVSNISNSYGVCDNIGGVHYCFWQNITNDIVRYTIQSETITEFDGMGGVTDTSLRSPAIRPLVTGDGDVVFTGLFSNLITKLCAWSTNTETLKAAFNTGSCVTVSTSDDVAYNGIHHPAIFDIDGGSSNEIGVVAGWRDVNDHNGGVFVYDGSGSLLYWATHTIVSTASDASINIYNPIPLLVDTDESNSQYSFCSVLESESKRRVMCAGQVANEYFLDSATVCRSAADVVSQCNWIGGDFNSINGQVNESGTTQGYSEAIGEDKYLSFTGKISEAEDSSAAFEVNGLYWASGDVTGDAILDIVTNVGSTVYIYAAVFENDIPYWDVADGDPALFMNGADPLCVNENYTIATWDNNNYEDDNSDSIRLATDCYGDGSVWRISFWAAANTDQMLYTNCVWNRTGSFVVDSYLQDTHMADISITNVSTVNRVQIPIVVTDDEDICNPPGTTTQTDTMSSTGTAGDSPGSSFAAIFAEFGLTGTWLFIIWLFVMFMATYGMFALGLNNPFVIGIANVFLLGIGWLFSAVPTVLMVVIGIMLAAIMVFNIFNRGG